MKLTITIIIATFCIDSSISLAQWSNDPSENLKVVGGGINPRICTDDSGGAYIAWETGAPPNRRLLRIQRLDRFGFKQFPEQGLPIRIGEFDQANLILFEDGAGGAIVVFNELLPVADTLKAIAFAQRFDSSGNRVWGDSALVVSSSPANQIPLTACGDGEGGAIIFWSEDRDQNGREELYGNKIDEFGNRSLGDEGVLIIDSEIDISAKAICDDRQEIILSYNEKVEIIVQKFNDAMIPLWEEGVNLGILPFRRMMSDGTGGVVLSSKIQTFFDNQPFFRLLAQRIDKDGRIIWGHEGIALIDSVSNPSQVPVIEKNDEDIFFVWSDNRNDSLRIYAQLVSPIGELKWEKGGIRVSIFPSIKGSPQVMSDEFDGIAVIFGDARQPDQGIYGQRLDSTGKNLWQDDDVLISNRSDAGRGRQITSDGSGGAIVTWYEIGAGTGNGVFVQQISRNGKLGDVVVSVKGGEEETNIPIDYYLFQNYPNPFNPFMTIKYRIPAFSHVSLKIFDITGKEVITLVDENQDAGVHQITWNGKDEKGGDVASGIYIYRLQAGNPSTRSGQAFMQSRKAIYLK